MEDLEDRRLLTVEANFTFSPLTIAEREIDFGFQDAIVLDGNDDAVDLTAGESAFDTLNLAATLEAWFRVDAFDAPNQTILSKGNLWELSRDGTTNTVKFSYDGIEVAATTNVNDGNWHHVAGTVGVGGLAIYVDGLQENFLSVPVISLPVNNQSAEIGANSINAGREFKGAIDEVRVWNVRNGITPESIRQPLSGNENGLVAYYTFNDGTAADRSPSGADGVLLGGPTFEPYQNPDIIGLLDVELSGPVPAADSPGIILNYSISGSAVSPDDFYTSQLDLSTTDMNPPTNSIFIAEGESSARIAIAALEDAIDEGTETITITLQSDTDPFGVGGGPRYTLGTDVSRTVDLLDGGTHAVGAALVNAYGENATSFPNFVVNPFGEATLSVKLTSQPEAPVNVNINRSPSVGMLSTSVLTFDETDWDLPQPVTISGLGGLITDDDNIDLLTQLQFNFFSDDNDYDFSRFVNVYDASDSVKLNVDEGGTTASVTPTVGILPRGDATEADNQPGSFTVASDLASPDSNLRVFYRIAQGTNSLGTQYEILNDFEQSLSLDGVDDYAEIANSPSINFGTSDNFTVESWVRVDPGGQLDLVNADNDIIEKWNGAGGYPFVIRYNNQTQTLSAARWDGTNNPSINSQTSVDDGRYHHVAFVKEGTSLSLYIDGNLEGTTTDTTTGATANNSPLNIGRRGNGINHFRGDVDELRIWDRPLTQAELQTRSSAPTESQLPGLVGYWNFDGSTLSGTTVSELTGLANNAVLTGSTLINSDLRFVDIPAGSTAASVLIEAVDDQVAEAPLPLSFELVSDSGYQISSTQAKATLAVQDNDTAGIETATLTNLGSLDTLFDTSTNINDAFTFNVDSFRATAGGAAVAVSVSLNEDPVGPVELTLTDQNSIASQTLNFAPGNAGPKVAMLNLAQATDGGLGLIATTDTNLDPTYGELSFTLPFRRTGVRFDSGTALTVTEDGRSFPFGVRLSSQPTAPVTVTLNSSDSSEGQISESLVFNASNWNQYQTARVDAQDDSFEDGDRIFRIFVQATSVDSIYNSRSADSTLTNEDNESRVDNTINTNNSSDIVANLTPVFHTAGESAGPGQFEILLSEPAPLGGLFVDYVVFEQSATMADLGLPELVERLGDNNPLSLTEVAQPDFGDRALSLAFADIDLDRDQDVLISYEDATTVFLENVGTPEIPDFVQNQAANPASGTGGFGATLADIDGDGDADVIQVNSSRNGLLYFENQLVETGTLSFIQQTGALNPFDGLPIVNPETPSFVDIDNDGRLELFLTREDSIGPDASDFFENVNGTYSLSSANPLDGFEDNNFEGYAFGDWDQDGDQDAVIGAFGDLRYLENVGTPTTPQFVERFGDFSPTTGTDGNLQKPFFVDINDDGDLDVFHTNLESTGELASLFQIRYYESPEVQTVFIPEGQDRLLVQVPVVDDLLDEADESLEVALVSRLPQSFNLVTTGDFDNEFDLVVTQAYDGIDTVTLGIDPTTLGNLLGSELAIGTVLNFSGGTQAIVQESILIDTVSSPLDVRVTVPMGQAIEVGERATTTFDSEITITAFDPLSNGQLGLRIAGAEATKTLVIPAGTQLSFSGGTVVSVDTKTTINVFEVTPVPVSIVSGTTVGGFETTTLTARVGELPILVDEPGIDFFALSAGTELPLSDGSIFLTTEPDLVKSVIRGDYNQNGIVDSADFTIWQDTLGSTTQLAADGNGNGIIDQGDFDLMVQNFGLTTPGEGVVLAGVVIVGNDPIAGQTTTLTQAGYRTSVDLDVTAALSGGAVGLQIAEAGYGSFTLPAGTLLQFSGNAAAIVDADTVINNTSGTVVPVSLTTDSGSNTINIGEGTETSDFFTGVTLRTTQPGVDDGFIFVEIVDPGVSVFELTAGTELVFSGGAIVTVDITTIIDESVNPSTDVQVSIAPNSPVSFVSDIQANETADVRGLEVVSKAELRFVDDDEAGVTLTPSGTVTNESGMTQTVEVVLDTQPREEVTVVIGTDSTEGVLSDNDETDEAVIELLFTPLNWNIPQTITVRGVDDDVDDGNTGYALRTTIVSQDTEYTDDVVPIGLGADIFSPGVISLFVDDVSVIDTLLGQLSTLRFNNGAEILVAPNGSEQVVNFESRFYQYSLIADVDTIGINRNAVVNDGDQRTMVAVTSGFDSGTGTVSLQLDALETAVLSATLRAGRELRFSNGTIARLDTDVVIGSGSPSVAPVTLLEGTSISVAETTFFEENLNVAKAYDSDQGQIELEVADPLISAITLAAGTELEFSNGALGTLSAQTSFANNATTLVNITLNPTVFTKKATAYNVERLVPDLAFTNQDDDGVGIAVFQTDFNLAVAEGNSNNFFSVVLDSQPTDPVEVTLTPSDDNIRLQDDFMGEPISIFFDESNWNLPQAIEVTAVDDTVLEYDHKSLIQFGVISNDAKYAAVALPNAVEVFIEDDELPIASIETVAGAIEATAPGYFVITLDQPAPTGFDETGLLVTYTLGGTADPVGLMDETPDLLPLAGGSPITGVARIAPGATRSALIAFPIDDFKAEGVNLVVTSNYDDMDPTIELGIDVAPFIFGGYNAMDQTVSLRLQDTDMGGAGVETTILGAGTTLKFANGATVLVTQSTIVGEDVAVAVAVSADPLGPASDSAVYQQVPLPSGTDLRFAGGAVVTTQQAATLTNENGTAVPATLTEGDSLALTANTEQASTALPGESLTVTLTADANSDYEVGAAATASLLILDNDKPGLRIAEVGDRTTAIEGEAGSQFFISLLSQPASPVTIQLSNLATSRALVLESDYPSNANSIGIRVDDPNIDSLFLPAGNYLFGTTTVNVQTGTTLFGDQFADVDVTLNGALTAASDMGNYEYNELSFANGSDTLVFTSDNWFRLQPVTVLGTDDAVVERGESHTTDIGYQLITSDPNYSSLTVNDQTIELIDRRFDVQNTYQAITQGFLSLEDSIENVSLPIIGNFEDVAPPFIDLFLEGLVEEIRATDNLTVETLTEAFNVAINNAIGVDQFSVEVTAVTNDEIAFLLSFSDSLMASVPLNSDLGLEALNISIESEGTLDLAVDYGVSLGFGISKTDGFYLNVDETAFEVAAGLTLSEDFTATGSLGFLQLDIGNAIEPVNLTVQTDFDDLLDTEIELLIDDLEIESFVLEPGTVIEFDGGFSVVVDGETELSNMTSVLVPITSATGPITAGETSVVGDVEGTGIDASFVVSLEDANDTSGDSTRLTLAELSAARQGPNPFEFLTYGFSGNAALDLDVTTSVSGNASFPSFGFNLFSGLPLFNYENEADAGADETPTLTVAAGSGFTNVPEGATTMLTVMVSGVTQNARITKGTQLTFNGDRVIVDKTVTIAPDSSGALRVKVVDDMDGMTETVSVGVGESTSLASSAFNLAFNDITLDLGEFVTDLLGPVISSINGVLEPFQPIIDVLTEEVELLSKIGLAGVFDQDDDGAATLVEVALTLAGGLQNGNTAARFEQFVGAVTGVIELTQSLADLEASIAAGGTLALEFGSYELQGFKGASSNADATTVDPETEGMSSDPSMSPEDQTMATGNSRVSNFFGKLDDLGITLDVVENPLNVIKLFLGQDIDLITWDVPELDLGFEIERSFPVFGTIRGLIRGEFNAYSDLVFGFDTFGFSQWKESDFSVDDAYLVFDGFYLSDWDPETGEDVDELTLDATIAAGVEASVVIASIEAVGGITGTAGLDFVDVGEYTDESDGRIRGSELLSRINMPAQLIEVAGSVEAFLEIAVKIGINLGFWKIETTVYEVELARVTLFEFGFGGGDAGNNRPAGGGEVLVGVTSDWQGGGTGDHGPLLPTDGPPTLGNGKRENDAASVWNSLLHRLPPMPIRETIVAESRLIRPDGGPTDDAFVFVTDADVDHAEQEQPNDQFFAEFDETESIDTRTQDQTVAYAFAIAKADDLSREDRHEEQDVHLARLFAKESDWQQPFRP